MRIEIQKPDQPIKKTKKSKKTEAVTASAAVEAAPDTQANPVEDAIAQAILAQDVRETVAVDDTAVITLRDPNVVANEQLEVLARNIRALADSSVLFDNIGQRAAYESFFECLGECSESLSILNTLIEGPSLASVLDINSVYVAPQATVEDEEEYEADQNLPTVPQFNTAEVSTVENYISEAALIRILDKVEYECGLPRGAKLWPEVLSRIRAEISSPLLPNMELPFEGEISDLYSGITLADPAFKTSIDGATAINPVVFVTSVPVVGAMNFELFLKDAQEKFKSPIVLIAPGFDRSAIEIASSPEFRGKDQVILAVAKQGHLDELQGWVVEHASEVFTEEASLPSYGAMERFVLGEVTIRVPDSQRASRFVRASKV